MAGVGRFILLILLALVGYLMFKGSRLRSRRGEGDASKVRPVESMVVCAHCGVHLPESDSVHAGDRYFCSEEHRRLAG